MKTIVLILALTLTSQAFAWGHSSSGRTPHSWGNHTRFK